MMSWSKGILPQTDAYESFRSKLLLCFGKHSKSIDTTRFFMRRIGI
jgi:hypothetical protein